MRSRLLTLLAIASVTQFSFAEKRAIACRTPAIAASCYTIHGRLNFAMGAYALHLWQIGTPHVYRIYSGAKGFHDETRADNEAPEIPANLQAIYSNEHPEIYADFELCPLEPHIPGHMQAACIESATHLFIKKD